MACSYCTTKPQFISKTNLYHLFTTPLPHLSKLPPFPNMVNHSYLRLLVSSVLLSEPSPNLNYVQCSRHTTEDFSKVSPSITLVLLTLQFFTYVSKTISSYVCAGSVSPFSLEYSSMRANSCILGVLFPAS